MGRSSLSAGIALGLGALLGACSSESLGPHAGTGAGGVTGQTGGSGGSRPSTGGSGGDAGGGLSGSGGSGGDAGGSGGTLGGSGGDLGGSGPTGPACVVMGRGVSSATECPLPIGSLCSTATLTSCGLGEYCQVAFCGDSSGFCETMPDLATCTGPAELVCGCDDGVYDSTCAASANATSIRNFGICPPLPSGPCSSQSDCGGETYANLVTCVPATCDGPTGTCQPVGQGCNITLSKTDTYDVCGCDGQTYSDPCVAHNAGVTVAHQGDCTVTPDAGASL